MGAGGFVGGLLIPRSEAADGLANEGPPLVTAEVSLEVVDAPVTVQGSVSKGDVITVLHTPLDSAVNLPLVTEVSKKPGDDIASGSLLLAVAGRPYVALHVQTPLYRPLHPGDSGPDVLAFEQALSELIPGDYDVDEEFTENTLTAASALWDGLGYDLPTKTSSVQVPESSATSTPAATVPPSSQTGPLLTTVEIEYVDIREIVQLSSGTAVVSSIAEVGDLANSEDPVSTLRSGAGSVRFRVTVVEEAQLTVGASVVLRTADRPDANATVETVGPFELATADQGAGGNTAVGAGRDASVSLPQDWSDLDEGTAVQVSIAVGADAVLAVPLSAIRDAAGDPYVVLEESESGEAGDSRPVEVVKTGDGWAQISESAELQVGDVVRISP